MDLSHAEMETQTQRYCLIVRWLELLDLRKVGTQLMNAASDSGSSRVESSLRVYSAAIFLAMRLSRTLSIWRRVLFLFSRPPSSRYFIQ